MRGISRILIHRAKPAAVGIKGGLRMRTRVLEHKHRLVRVAGGVGIEVIMEEGGGVGMDTSLGHGITIITIAITAVVVGKGIMGEGEGEVVAAAEEGEGRWEAGRHTGVWMMLERVGDMMEGLCMRISPRYQRGIKGRVEVGTTK